MRRVTLLTILTYYKLAASNADRVYDPWNADPRDPHEWYLPSCTHPLT